MATFSEGFLNNLGRPAMTQSMFNLGTTIGGIPRAYAEDQKRKALAGHDTTTTQGQIDLLAAQIKQAKDPAERLQMGQQLVALKGYQSEEEKRSQVKQATESLAGQIEALGDTGMAALVRSGAVTPTSGYSALQTLRVADEGVESRQRALKATGLAQTSVFSGMTDEEIGDLSNADYLVAQNLALEESERTKFVSALEKRGVDADVVKGYKDGFYSEADVKGLITGQNKTSYANRKIMLLDGKPVFTADVTEGDKKFVGYMNEDGGWTPITDPGRLEKVGNKAVQGVSRVDVEHAATYLNKSDVGVSSSQKRIVSIALAAKVKEMLANGEAKNQYEAYGLAMQEIELPEEGAGLTEVIKSFFSDSKPRSRDEDSVVIGGKTYTVGQEVVGANGQVGRVTADGQIEVD